MYYLKISETSVYDKLAILISYLWKCRMSGISAVAKLFLMVLRREREKRRQKGVGRRGEERGVRRKEKEQKKLKDDEVGVPVIHSRS